MALPQSEGKNRTPRDVCYAFCCGFIPSPLKSGHNRRNLFSVIAIAALFLAIFVTNKLYSMTERRATSTGNRSSWRGDQGAERGLLTIISEYENPIIIATIRGYSERERCSSDDEPESLDAGALAKLTVISDSAYIDTTNKDTALLVHVGEPQTLLTKNTIDADNGLNQLIWKTQFRLDVGPPPSQYFSLNGIGLCYRIDWRVEYVSLETAMADYPSKLCSFVGKPKFHRKWESTEFSDESPRRGSRWLVRKDPGEDWQWAGVFATSHDSYARESISASNTPCASWKKERPYSIEIIGDSQPSYTCFHLIYGLTGSIATPHPKVKCKQIKQTLQNSATFDQYSHGLQQSVADIVIFNPSGLWEAAYGALDDFRENFQKLLTYIPTKRQNGGSKRTQYYFFAPTTAVHPINYPGLPTDNKKWSMTQPRVMAINAIATDLVMQRREHYKSKAYDSISISTLPAPWDSLSLSREDDPLTPTDMRHFDFSTNEMLLTALLCKLDEIWESEK
ncbi:hypothetical protein HJC23_013109 [Cyclotella cryptica]|uniref:Uncharacterized protein n=1 Tax=Cyclotella cryptica TaxID=29204 RepID=A0ABD3QN37_9STRA|eukprot:CCRYP_003915-RA/>CCRYP_003915-RA protein AED:0.01 eAED:0.01 QI:258/-1/1/1/-1/1/1/688/506